MEKAKSDLSQKRSIIRHQQNIFQKYCNRVKVRAFVSLLNDYKTAFSILGCPYFGGYLLGVSESFFKNVLQGGVA
jgi:hypothetical protein